MNSQLFHSMTLPFSVLLLLGLLRLAESGIMNPINSSCLRETESTLSHIPSLNISLHMFHLSPFSHTFIEVDLRHLEVIPTVTHSNDSIFTLGARINGNDNFEGGQDRLIADITPDSNIFSFYVTAHTYLWLYFYIQEGYEAYTYMLMESVSVAMERQNKRIPQQEASFVFMVKSLHNINLPYNRPNLSSDHSHYLEKISEVSRESRMLTAIETNTYWTTQQSLALPYIPYFSNCLGEPDHMYLAQIMQDPTNCSLIQISDTEPINEFKFGSSPHSDSCKIERECVYDQIPSVRSEFPYWQTLTSDSVLFSVTQNQVQASEYDIGMTFNDIELVDCKVNESKGSNSSQEFPLKVKLTLDYYQVSKEVKKMIACTVSYSLYTASERNFRYQLEIETRPLNHTNIMLAFGFDWYVYMIVFVLIGLISNIENLILWMFHSCVSRLKKKVFRIRIYLRVIWQIAKGTIKGLIFFIILLFCVTIIMNGKIFDTYLYSQNLPNHSPRVFWDALNTESIFDYSSSRAQNYRAGRMGISFLVVGSVIIFHTSRYFVGCEKSKREYEDYVIMGRRFRPREWNRGKFIFGTFFFIVIQFIFIYFAYSKLYSQNIWAFIVVMKIIQMVMEEVTKSVYQDLLPCLPLKIITDITAYMNTLSANNFYDFLFSFLIDVAINMIEKAYISQLQNIIVEKVQNKIQEIERFYANLINDTEGELKESNSEDMDEDGDENTFVIINGTTEEIKFFENQEVQFHRDNSFINLNPARIEETEKNLKEKLSLYYKELNERENNLEKKENKTRKRPAGENNEANSQSPSEKEKESEERSYIFEMLLDNIILLFTFFVQPFVVLVYWITYDESKILGNYGIESNVVVLYLLSAITIAFFTIINVILIFHLLECYVQINFEQPTTELLTRFINRRVFWKAHDGDINKNIGASLRGADHYCLSWQFFLLLTVYISSMMLVMLGISILMSVQYNPLKDVVNIFIIFFWYFFVKFLIWLIQGLGYKLNIDGWSDLEGNQNRNAILDEKNLQDLIAKSGGNDESEEPTNQGLLINQSENELIESHKSSKKWKKKEKSMTRMIPRASSKIFSLISHNSSEKELEEMLMNSVLTEDNLETKIETICKKLEKNFANQKFIFHFFKQNRAYVKKNLEKILPLVDEMPEMESRILSNPIDELAAKKETKNYDPSVLEILSQWKNRTESEGGSRAWKGKELEQGLQKCNFCFNTWAIYHGFGGMCLKCSQVFHSKKE